MKFKDLKPGQFFRLDMQGEYNKRSWSHLEAYGAVIYLRVEDQKMCFEGPPYKRCDGCCQVGSVAVSDLSGICSYQLFEWDEEVILVTATFADAEA